MPKSKRPDAATRAEQLNAKIKRLAKKAKKAEAGAAARLAKKRIKRAQRTQKKLLVQAAGGLKAMAKAAKAAGE